VRGVSLRVAGIADRPATSQGTGGVKHPSTSPTADPPNRPGILPARFNRMLSGTGMRQTSCSRPVGRNRDGGGDPVFNTFDFERPRYPSGQRGNWKPRWCLENITGRLDSERPVVRPPPRPAAGSSSGHDRDT